MSELYYFIIVYFIKVYYADAGHLFVLLAINRH